MAAPRRQIKSLVAGIIMASLGTTAQAQQFSWQATLQKVPADGFYQIWLTPELIAKTKNPDLSDIRIFDQKAEVGYLKGTVTGNYIAIPAPRLRIVTDASLKLTRIEANFDQPYLVNRLLLKFQGPPFYKRDAQLVVDDPDFKRTNRGNKYKYLRALEISSGKETEILLTGGTKYNKMSVFIENEDNPPLTVQTVHAFQQKRYLTAAFKKDKTYVLKLGGETILPPKYDLENFRDSIPDSLPVVNIQNLAPIKSNIPEKQTIFKLKAWIWLTLLLLMAIISIISYKMISEMKKNSRNQTKE